MEGEVKWKMMRGRRGTSGRVSEARRGALGRCVWREAGSRRAEGCRHLALLNCSTREREAHEKRVRASWRERGRAWGGWARAGWQWWEKFAIRLCLTLSPSPSLAECDDEPSINIIKMVGQRSAVTHSASLSLLRRER